MVFLLNYKVILRKPSPIKKNNNKCQNNEINYAESTEIGNAIKIIFRIVATTSKNFYHFNVPLERLKEF